MTARHGTGLCRPVDACTPEQKSYWFLPSIFETCAFHWIANVV